MCVVEGAAGTRGERGDSGASGPPGAAGERGARGKRGKRVTRTRHAARCTHANITFKLSPGLDPPFLLLPDLLLVACAQKRLAAPHVIRHLIKLFARRCGFCGTNDDGNWCRSPCNRSDIGL